MPRQHVQASELTTLCFDCFHSTRKEAVMLIIRNDQNGHANILFRCSELCGIAARSLILGWSTKSGLIRECIASCEASADICEAQALDACACLLYTSDAADE